MTGNAQQVFECVWGGGYFWLRWFCYIIYCLIYFYFWKKSGGAKAPPPRPLPLHELSLHEL